MSMWIETGIDVIAAQIAVTTSLIISFVGLLKIPFLRKLLTLLIDDYNKKRDKDMLNAMDEKVRPVKEDVDELKKKLEQLENELSKMNYAHLHDEVHSLRELVDKILLAKG